VTIEQFIRTQIEAVDNLRALLLLRFDPQARWDAGLVSAQLHLPPKYAARVLGDLAAKGLIDVSGGLYYRYGPPLPEFAPLIEQLAPIDQEHTVSLLNLIYARPGDVKAFVEAFRGKREAPPNPLPPP
jgi:hypothetical protein